MFRVTGSLYVMNALARWFPRRTPSLILIICAVLVGTPHEDGVDAVATRPTVAVREVLDSPLIGSGEANGVITSHTSKTHALNGRAANSRFLLSGRWESSARDALRRSTDRARKELGEHGGLAVHHRVLSALWAGRHLVLEGLACITSPWCGYAHHRAQRTRAERLTS